MCLPAGRCAIRTRPERSKRAPATTWMPGRAACGVWLASGLDSSTVVPDELEIVTDGSCDERLAGRSPHSLTPRYPCPANAPWQCLNFLPEPQGHGSLRPTFFTS